MSPALRRAHALLHDALMTPRYTTAICVLLILFELVMNLAIIHRVPYTEIDWTAYMQEVQGVISGEFNYMNLKGDTGPLVYPAGFVWIYGLLWKATNGGQGIRTAQLVFACLYMANLCVVLAIYRRIRGFPPVLLILLVVSKRVHSIFVLRLFNDPVAMLFAYICVLCLGSTHYRQRQWKQVWSALALSAGISVKMNVLLFAPGVLYMWWRIGGIRLVAVQATVVAVTQAIVAVPFLATYPTEYVARAFEFGRQFAFQWTVNWRFLGEDLFLSPMWAAMLLVVHLALLTVFAVAVWPRLAAQSFVKVVADGVRRGTRRVDMDEAALVVFTANFIGIVCARSLHYQFYSWYFHTLPLLLFKTQLPMVVQFIVWAAIEVCWNIYPSTIASSLVLLAAHLSILAGLIHAGLTTKATKTKATLDIKLKAK